MKYPRKRKPAGTIACQICGQFVNKRGYRGHLWLKHGLKEGIKEDKRDYLDDSVNESMTVNEYLDFLAEEHLKDGFDPTDPIKIFLAVQSDPSFKQAVDGINHVPSEVADIDLSEGFELGVLVLNQGKKLVMDILSKSA